MKPREFSFSVERKSNSVNLNCSGSGMFPEPKFTLFHGSRTIPVTDSVLVVNQDNLSSSVHKELQLRYIEDTSLLGCTLQLPGTNFSITEQQIFRKYRTRLRSDRQIKNKATHHNLSVFQFLIMIISVNVFLKIS